MIIEIKVFSILRQHLPPPEKRPEGDLWDIPEGVTVKGLLDRLGLPGDQDMILLVNGLHATEASALKPGDALGVFPMVAGG